jgi:hypothetical protein
MKLKYYTDPGHGWIAIKRKVLNDLEVADKITVFSYQKGQTVYLEEDCDAFLVMQKLSEQGITVTFDRKHTNNRSPIRNYNRFDK